MFNEKMFEKVLHEQVLNKNLTLKTKDGYIRCIHQIEKHCRNKDEPSAVSLEKAINKLCGGNKQMIKYIAAVKKYERDVLKSPQLLLYGEPLSRLRQIQPSTSQGKKLSNSEVTYAHKINALRDMKLKIALRLQKQSGLRIAEVADLVKADILFDEDSRTIKLRVRNGKGGKARTVHTMQDEYLFNNLKELIKQLEDSEKLFYSAEYLIKKANEHDMETHDLRRVNSRQRFRAELAEGAGRREARSAVSRELGHSKPKITNMYLGDEWNGGSEEDEQGQNGQR